MRIKLEEPFASKWRRGYLRTSKDKRKRVDLINSKSHRTTISYARYLVCVSLGYELSSEFEVDHIDTDCTNDSINNLQVLTIEEHRRKTSSENSTGRSLTDLVCPNCNKEFKKFTNLIYVEKPKCSRKCNAEYTRKQGKWLGKPKKQKPPKDKTTRKPRKQVKLSVKGANFKIILNDVCYTFPEDEHVDLEFKRLFQSLGFKVQINEYLW